MIPIWPVTSTTMSLYVFFENITNNVLLVEVRQRIEMIQIVHHKWSKDNKYKVNKLMVREMMIEEADKSWLAETCLGQQTSLYELGLTLENHPKRIIMSFEIMLLIHSILDSHTITSFQSHSGACESSWPDMRTLLHNPAHHEPSIIHNNHHPDSLKP
jgi:hypothetical protein